ncbi:hypothetical protein J6590_049199 [Homalodisca vitripennis]|nr:hypothetical protein J6590_049199 [Homalodisca vitripennis]
MSSLPWPLKEIIDPCQPKRSHTRSHSPEGTLPLQLTVLPIVSSRREMRQIGQPSQMSQNTSDTDRIIIMGRNHYLPA